MTNLHNRWHPFEHQLYRDLRAQNIADRKLLLMVSGGADSMALIAALTALEIASGHELVVLHCHHGDSSDFEQKQFRDQAQGFVQSFCATQNLPFYCEKYEGYEQSEAAFRQFRKMSAEKVRQKIGGDFSVWSHHRDDFLETQILRLIRGVGPEALWAPMKFQNQFELRPFLSRSRGEIQAYLRDKQIEWVEDPSNQNQDYLRNWLRQNWLPALEEKCPGALDAFSRSLDLLQESHLSHLETVPSEVWAEDGLNRSVFLTLNEAQKKQVLAQYLRRCGKLEFSQNQLKEVMRHLDISQLNHTFKAAQVDWSLTRERIKIASLI
jgi:tRNA(Ile)-lysidine synthase